MFFKKRKFIKFSRFFSKPIYIYNLNVFFKNNFLFFKNNNNFYIFKVHEYVFIKKHKNFLYLFFLNLNDKFKLISLYSLIKNIIIGLNKYFLKKLILTGVGYKFILKNNFLFLYLGYSHPIIFFKPKGIKLYLFSNIILFISGINKHFVNLTSSIIKKFRKFDIYKGKGIKYIGENIKLKLIKKK